ncbi:hypothetical protein PPTG_20665 [Phytophthora nicotianae INRA-310]|uniref:Uncharacterized protein n=1 Tax=Phytophthora nicotianae (strain INRA-310) TaxID=761204 RepID=W2RG77_PHYN3|nr:hypothetical protein PPTG_20665 [Phytophthora nicotianae INRA-310]ETN23555.1 hypothetical protein PPTG_20665 [Phytophthora nicotianae INRA-310]
MDLSFCQRSSQRRPLSSDYPSADAALLRAPLDVDPTPAFCRDAAGLRCQVASSWQKNSQLVHTFYSTKSASERSRAASGKASMVIMPLHWRIGKTSEHSASRSDWHIIVARSEANFGGALPKDCESFFFGADQSVTEFFGSRAG